jgi:hypothetical protein
MQSQDEGAASSRACGSWAKHVLCRARGRHSWKEVSRAGQRLQTGRQSVFPYRGWLRVNARVVSQLEIPFGHAARRQSRVLRRLCFRNGQHQRVRGAYAGEDGRFPVAALSAGWAMFYRRRVPLVACRCRPRAAAFVNPSGGCVEELRVLRLSTRWTGLVVVVVVMAPLQAEQWAVGGPQTIGEGPAACDGQVGQVAPGWFEGRR